MAMTQFFMLPEVVQPRNPDQGLAADTPFPEQFPGLLDALKAALHDPQPRQADPVRGWKGEAWGTGL